MRVFILIFLIFSSSIFADRPQTSNFKPNSLCSHRSGGALRKENEKKAREQEKKDNAADYAEYSRFIKKIGSGVGSCNTAYSDLREISAAFNTEIYKCNHTIETQLKIHCIKQAIDLCRSKIGLILSLLKALEGEHLDWQVRIKRDCKSERNQQKAILDTLNNELTMLGAVDTISKLCESAMTKEREAIGLRDSMPVRNFVNSPEVVEALNRVVTLYEEASADCHQALGLPSRNDQKEVLHKALNHFNQQAEKYKKEAADWPAIILSRRKAYYDQIDLLKKECTLFESEGKIAICRDIYKRIELIHQEIINNGENITEELSLCRGKLSELESAAIAKRLAEHQQDVSPELSRCKDHLNQFYSGLSRRQDSEGDGQNAIPLDGQGNEQFLGQFYRYLVQREITAVNLRVQVSEGGVQLYEEKIAIPLQGDLWHHYIAVDQMLLVPDGDLHSKFGLKLRLTIISDPYHRFAMVIGHKGSSTKYEFTFFLDDERLYHLHFIPPPPSQLEILGKPKQLSKRTSLLPKPLVEATYNTCEYLKSRYPDLDLFVEEMKNNPLSIAQYVHNEIENIDPFLKRHHGVFYPPAIHRNPSRTFLEKQGSPWEQCQLLVYLLKKAGYDAQYLEGECCLPASYVEELLFLKLAGESHILLNYPGVLFFDGRECHALFPWMKEISTVEGYDLYNCLPDKYGNAEKWLMQYLCNDEEIHKHIGPDGDDTVGVLFVRFVEEQLRKQGLALQDVGTHRLHRKKQYPSWNDFPRPIIQDSLKSLHDLSSRDDLFAHISIRVNSEQHPCKKIEVNRMKLADFSCQSHALYFSAQGASDHLLHFTCSNDFKNEQTVLLDPSDHHIDITVTYETPLGPHENISREEKFSIAKGTCAALCHNSGGANARLTSLFAEQFTQKIDEHEKLHAFFSFVGAAYFEKCSRAQKILASIHKISPVTCFCVGLAKLSPDPSSISDLRYPQIDMHQINFKVAHSHPYSPYKETHSTLKQYSILTNADASSNEHQVLREIYRDPYAISTVKLLQLAHLKHQKKGSSKPGFLVLTAKSFADLEADPISGYLLHFSHVDGFNFNQIKNCSQGQWNLLKSLFSENALSFAYAYMTPCAISSQDGFGLKLPSYTGIGTLHHGSSAHGALISNGERLMNGGYGSRLTNNFMQTINNSEYQLVSSGNSYSYISAKSIPFMNAIHSFQTAVNSSVNVGFSKKSNSSGLGESFLNQTISRLKAEVRLDFMSVLDWVGDPVDVVTGAFYVDEVDLALPGAFPLEIRRNYSSQNSLPGILGFGWKLSLNPFLLEEDDKLFATERDGTVIAYRRDENQDRWVVLPHDNPNLRNYNKQGIGGITNPFHAYIENNHGHILHSADGSTRVFQDKLLTIWSDHAGNSLSFSYDNGRLKRIENSSGAFLCFKYNYGGKISEIFANDGRTFFYTYDSQGDLATVTLPNGALITYEYDQFHRIIRESKPHGRLLENTYADNKVSQQRSPLGPQQQMMKVATFKYSDGVSLVTDGNGGCTEYKIYNNQIYKITDPDGHETLQSWFQNDHTYFDAETEQLRQDNPLGTYPRSLKSIRDKRGLFTHYTYDDHGNIKELSIEGDDLTGDSKTSVSKNYTYDEHHLCVQEEVLNRKTITTYDATLSYLPKRIENYVDDIEVSFVDFEYTEHGLIKQENRSGAVTSCDYDSRDFPIQRTQYTGTDDPPVITRFSYNDQGQCVDLITGDRVIHSDYDLMGNAYLTTVLLPSGKVISRIYTDYDQNNEIIRKQGDDPHNIVYLDYNAAGLLKASRHQLSRISNSSIIQDGMAYTLYEYDPCGRLLENIDPLGNITAYTYDGLGRILTTKKAGISTQFTYEAGGLVSSIIAPGGGITSRIYTTNGYLKSEHYPDGTEISYVYDFFGRQIQKNKNGKISSVHYRDATCEEALINGELVETRRQDARGNLLSLTDSAGFTWLKTYDALDRIKSETKPNGDITSWCYRGDTVICMLPNGEQTVQRYEAGSLAECQTFDANGILIIQISYNQFPEQSMTQEIHGDVVMNTLTNTLGQPILIQQGDKITIHHYDAAGNCISSVDGEGNTTFQEFDSFGRLIQKTLPDGALIHYDYDADSNLIAYRMPGNLSWHATYDSMGRKLAEWQENDHQCSQRWEYTYQNGHLDQLKDPLNRIHNYEYDTQSRIIQESVGHYIRSYTYDPRGLITSVIESGHEISKVERSYDSVGRLTQETISLNGVTLQNTQQQWTPSCRSLQIGDHHQEFLYRGGYLSRVSSDDFTISYDYALSGSLVKKRTPFSVVDIKYNDSALPDTIDLQLPNSHYYESLQWTPSGKLSSHDSTYPVPQSSHYTYTPRGFLKSTHEGNYTFDFHQPGIGVLTSSPNIDVPVDGIDHFGRIIQELRDIKPSTFTYDELGQVIRRNKEQFTWDPWGRLIGVTSDAYEWSASYDPLGRRLQTKYTPISKGIIWNSKGKTVVTTSLFDPEHEFQEIGVLTKEKCFWKIFRGSTCEAIIDSKREVAILHHDMRNNLIAVFTQQSIQWVNDYPTPYGPRAPPKQIQNLLSYTLSLSWQSKQVDPTGLIWLGARHYDPIGGRFLSPDPISHPICLDLYAYANGDPINYCDMDGRFSCATYDTIHSTSIGGRSSIPSKVSCLNLVELINNPFNRSRKHDLSHLAKSELPGGLRIGFMNGIWNGIEDASKSLTHISNLSGGYNIHGIYGSIQGVTQDLISCVLALNYIDTGRVNRLHDEWNDFFDKNKETHYLHFCHSRGAIDTRNALLIYPEERRERIIVVAIAPAGYIYRETCAKVTHYRAESPSRDVIPYIDSEGAERAKDTVVNLPSHSKASWFDHEFTSPTYSEAIEVHCKEYKQAGGKLK